MDEKGIEGGAAAGAAQEPQAEPAISRDTLLEMAAEGQRILGQGRSDEALTIADSILESEPEFVPGLALKGDVLERKGDIAGALAAYEKVLEIKPDSALDRIRAAHLKRQLAAADLEVEEAPNSRTAILTSAAAFVLFVVTVGAVFLSQNSRGSTGQEVAMSDGPQMSNFSVVPPVPTTGQEGQVQGQDPAQAAGQGSAMPPAAPDQATSRVQSPNPGFVPAPRQSGGSRIADPGSPEVEPVNPLPNGASIGIQPSGQMVPTPPPVQQSAPPAANPGARPDDPEVIGSNAPARENPGIIDIRPSQGQNNRIGSTGSTEATDDQEARQSAESLIRVARDAFVKGDYSRAADAYERALRLGASKGSTNQRLAQAYERLGRKGDAAGAYERAIAGYQAMLSSGSGDSARISAAIESCRQALKNIRG